MIYALLSAIALAAVMTTGDVLWDALHIRHRVANGLAHGAAMCLALGLSVGIRARKPLPAAVAGPLIGVTAAATFYVLWPSMRWGAMFAAWMLLWILFAILQRRLDRREDLSTALLRGSTAAVTSGVAFYLISGIWTGEHGVSNPVLRLGYWTFAFVPGFVALFFRRPAGAA